MANQTVGIHSEGAATAEEGMKGAGSSTVLLPRRVWVVEEVSGEVMEKR